MCAPVSACDALHLVLPSQELESQSKKGKGESSQELALASLSYLVSRDVREQAVPHLSVTTEVPAARPSLLGWPLFLETMT